MAKNRPSNFPNPFVISHPKPAEHLQSTAQSEQFFLKQQQVIFCKQNRFKAFTDKGFSG